MFNLGFTEMLLLAGIALIVIGPKQLPQMARMVGRMLNEFRRATGEFTSSINDIKSKTQNYMHETETAMRKIPESLMEESQNSDQSQKLESKDPPEEKS